MTAQGLQLLWQVLLYKVLGTTRLLFAPVSKVYQHMKKTYIVPQADIVEMDFMPIMTTVSREQIEKNAGSGSAETGSPNLSAGQYNKWSNIWKR